MVVVVVVKLKDAERVTRMAVCAKHMVVVVVEQLALTTSRYLISVAAHP